MRIALVLTALSFAIAPARAGELHARSGTARAHLLELYSSEGCSSCPPADAWISSLRGARGLWSEFVPVIFHVTYWDYLGWADPLADAAFTARQRALAASWGSGTVYTPGFALDGTEYRDWGGEIEKAAGAAGVLDARETDGRVVARFSPAREAGPYTLHAARLGFGLESKVAHGENAGRTLRHDFVALALSEAPMRASKGGTVAELRLAPGKVRAPREGLAVWVTDGRGRLVQAAGDGKP